MLMMSPEMIAKLKRSHLIHEKYRRYPYTDTVNKITIGIGYNLTDRGIDDEWINNQYRKDVSFFYETLSSYKWFELLCIDRQIVLLDMVFMGIKRFLTFKKMIKALEDRDYKTAAMEMLDSLWAKQVGTRATVLAHAMMTGVYEV
jgi:lysozyme